jgi:hypothetical protein
LKGVRHRRFYAGIKHRSVLYLDIEEHIPVRQQLKHVFQFRYFLAPESFGKPGTKVQFLQFRQCLVLHQAFAVAGPVDGLIMDDHQASVGAHMYVQFDAVGSKLQGSPECRHRVFRRLIRCAPVCGDHR